MKDENEIMACINGQLIEMAPACWQHGAALAVEDNRRAIISNEMW
jgi:hypothetical protein